MPYEFASDFWEANLHGYIVKLLKICSFRHRKCHLPEMYRYIHPISCSQLCFSIELFIYRSIHSSQSLGCCFLVGTSTDANTATPRVLLLHQALTAEHRSTCRFYYQQKSSNNTVHFGRYILIIETSLGWWYVVVNKFETQRFEWNIKSLFSLE